MEDDLTLACASDTKVDNSAALVELREITEESGVGVLGKVLNEKNSHGIMERD
jgi:hypothetical protein